MNNFQPLGILIPRYLTGTLKNGILLLYSGPSYLEFLDLMKRDDPDVYNRLLADVAKGNSPSSEVVRYRDADGNIRSTTNVGAGYVSGTDPAGKYAVEVAALNKPLLLIGKGVSYGLGHLPGFLKMITHPTWLKIYHGTRQKFTWKEARPYSKGNIGLHVSPNRSVAESFAKNGYVIEGYAPKPKVETIDIGNNNYNLLNTKYRFDARPENSGSYYDIVFPDTKRLKMLEEAGANPTVSIRSRSITGKEIGLLNTENTVNLNLRELLKLSKSANKEADNLMQKSTQYFKDKDEILNKEATDLLRNDGINSIKYNNVNATEGGGKESWILTNPSIVWNPTWRPIHLNTRFEYLSPIIPFTHD